MGLAVGETVGQYKIIECIGQGGMATIYKAHQLTLDRDVTLKVMHPVLKEDQSFINRLSREAKIIAKLDHPNIVTVYDLSQYDGVPFLVLRYIEGRTLKAVLQEQKLGTQQILKIARPVAEALAYAHSRGVLHRDVKPSNILIDNDGHVFLTDFGLARIAHSSESTSSHDMMIGSPNYISPEQAKSESVDARTDIYSLGVVLYEMFAGRVPFARETPYGTILAQINDAPPAPRSVNPKIPPAVEQVILKTLAKDPKQRYSSIREMMRALENAVRGPQAAAEETAASLPLVDYKPARTIPLVEPISSVRDQLRTAASSLGGKSDHRKPFLLAGAALVALLLLLACLAGVAFVALRSPLFGGPKTPLAVVGASTSVAAATSPTPDVSGTRSAPSESSSPTPTPTPPATPTQTAPAPTRQAAAPASILPHGKVAYSVATGSDAEQHSVWVVNADGSNPQKVADTAMWPSISPDGKRLAYYRMKDEGIYVANIDGGNPQKILVGETCCVQWSRESGHLMYVQGKLSTGDTHVKIANLDGSNIFDVTLNASPYNPTWSPDGTKIAYASCDPVSKNQCGIIVYDLIAKTSKMITKDGGGDPQWSPKGDKIVYQAGNPNVFVVNVDATGSKQLTSGKSHDGSPTWSSDGNFIFWRSDQDGKAWAIMVMRADGTNKRLVVDNVPPDGNRWGYESLSAGP